MSLSSSVLLSFFLFLFLYFSFFKYQSLAEAVKIASNDRIADVVAVQRTVAKASKSTVFLVDASKLGASAPVFLLPWNDIDRLLTNASTEVLTEASIILPTRTLVTC